MEPQQIPDQQLPPEQSPLPKIHNPLAVMQPGERVICDIKRHPIGLLGAYLVAGIILIVLAVLAFVVLPGSAVTEGQGQNMNIAAAVFGLVAILIILFVLVANIVYWGNRWIVTSDSITQMHQTGPFSKQSAQLSFENLEAVTTEQNGIFTHIFNFGTLKAETAGERSNFILTFCPNPSYYAQKILAAREAFEREHQTGRQALHHPQSVAQPPIPSSNQSFIQQTPQYAAGQVPPAYGSAPLPPPAEPQPPAPSSGQPPDTSDIFPEPGQPAAGSTHTNTRID